MVLVPGGSELRKTLPLPAVTRSFQRDSVRVAGSRSATQTATMVGSTLRRIGPANSRGRSTRSPDAWPEWGTPAELEANVCVPSCSLFTYRERTEKDDTLIIRRP